MLIVLHFHTLGYSPLNIAFLFLFYELFGVITNLVGGWLGARIGLNKTMNLGLILQVIALSMLLLPSAMLSLPWVMAAQALSGIAKDLNKMSAKSAVKQLIPENAQGKLYRWVALLTGSKNALKGVGFFLGALLLSIFGFQGAAFSMAIALFAIGLISLTLLQKDLGKAKNSPKFKQIFSKSPAINYLSAARFFLFGARDLWFVIALPVYLHEQLGWSHLWTGSFFALWVISYGAMQGLTPMITGIKQSRVAPAGKPALTNTAITSRALMLWASVLAIIPGGIALTLLLGNGVYGLIAGLLIFGAVFAINSAMHSYFIVHYANSEGTSLDVGFYYMANAAGRLVGTLLSGLLYQTYGLEACLWAASLFIIFSAGLAWLLPETNSVKAKATNA